MSFVDTLFDRIAEAGTTPLVVEMHGTVEVPATGADLMDRIARARGGLRNRGVVAGDTVVLLAANSAAWVATDLAILAEGAVVVPLYARQAVGELVEMIRDAGPRLVL